MGGTRRARVRTQQLCARIFGTHMRQVLRLWQRFLQLPRKVGLHGYVFLCFCTHCRIDARECSTGRGRIARISARAGRAENKTVLGFYPMEMQNIYRMCFSLWQALCTSGLLSMFELRKRALATMSAGEEGYGDIGAGWASDHPLDAMHSSQSPPESTRERATANREAFDAFCRRARIQEALVLMKELYEDSDEPSPDRRATVGAQRRATAFKSRAHKDGSWREVATALIEIECGAPRVASSVEAGHVGELGREWVRWTKASGKVFEDVAIPPQVARALSLKRPDGELEAFLPALQFQPPAGEWLSLQPGQATVYVRRPVPPRARALNAVYDMLCRQVWLQLCQAQQVARQAQGTSPALAARAGMAALRRWSVADRAAKSEERERAEAQRAAEAAREWEEWASQRARSRSGTRNAAAGHPAPPRLLREGPCAARQPAQRSSLGPRPASFREWALAKEREERAYKALAFLHARRATVERECEEVRAAGAPPSLGEPAACLTRPHLRRWVARCAMSRILCCLPGWSSAGWLLLLCCCPAQRSSYPMLHFLSAATCRGTPSAPGTCLSCGPNTTGLRPCPPCSLPLPPRRCWTCFASRSPRRIADPPGARVGWFAVKMTTTTQQRLWACVGGYGMVQAGHDAVGAALPWGSKALCAAVACVVHSGRRTGPRRDRPCCALDAPDQGGAVRALHPPYRLPTRASISATAFRVT